MLMGGAAAPPPAQNPPQGPTLAVPAFLAPQQTPPVAAASSPEPAPGQQAPDAAEGLVSAADPGAGLEAGQQRILNAPEAGGQKGTGAEALGPGSSGQAGQDPGTGQVGEQQALH